MTTSNARREYERLGSGTRLLLEEKRALRHSMMARRQEVSPAERARLSAAMTARLGTLPELVAASTSGGTVAGFVALPAKGEVDPMAALAAAHASGAHVALPRVSAEAPRLRFHDVTETAALLGTAALLPTDDTALVPGPYGLREPAPSAPEVAVESIDVMLLPGLAFDRAGRRLGYGGGYYDEAAGRLRATGRGFLVGIAYDFQIVERCPAGDADVSVDCVVTDRQVVRCAPALSSNGTSDGGRA